MRLREKKELLTILNDMLLKTEDYGLDFLKQNKENIIKTLEKIVVLSDYSISNMHSDINLSIDIDFIKLKKCIQQYKVKLEKYEDIKLEVVFLPYKASMWDSFESVYNEAKKDNKCNCSVVPIPYYELDDDRKPVNICYEGNLFPNHIEIVPYELYDIEKIKPDIIYIHNPYDDFNKITCIDSRYFSEKLSKLTDMLVYIPYYIDGSYEKSQDHLIYSAIPVPMNATKIIAQSKVHRDLFIENGIEESKVVNLGNPKFDKVKSISDMEYRFNNQWEDKLKDSFVFLFNLTIDDVLNNLQWANDLVSMIKLVSYNKGLGLIIRCHPLIEITIKTLKPDCLNLYKRIINMCKTIENIVIDDSPDAFMSFKKSDALISGYSSILFQYLATEKPILTFMKESKLNKNRKYCTDYSEVYLKDRDIDIVSFIEMVIKQEDYKRDIRVRQFKESITNIDENCGKKIHQYISNLVLK